MKTKHVFRRFWLLVTASLALYGLIHSSEVRAVSLGNMPADSILFLGNSVTLHGPYNEWDAEAHWGMAASEESKDYVHLLTSRIEAATGGTIYLPTAVIPEFWDYGYPSPDYQGNILNIADIFERNFNTWENARIQNQLDAQPDIVVVQFGENLEGGTPEELATALDTLLMGLKNSSNPNIFITSSILGTNASLDAIKKQACAADPSHRVFVDLNGIVDNSGVAGHPSDAGMQTIADTIFNAVVAHSTASFTRPWTLNIDINGRSSTAQNLITKSDAAVVGQLGDVWNGYTVDAAGASPNIVDPAESDFLVDASGNATTVKFELGTVGADAPFASSDDMANDVAFVEGPNAGTGFPTSATFTLSGLQAGNVYDMYIYAATEISSYASKFTVDGQSASTMLGATFSGTWRYGMDYVKIPQITVAEDGTIQGNFESAVSNVYGMFSGLQLVETEAATEVTGTSVNIDINGRSSTAQNLLTRSGAAAIGSAGDVWNGYSVDASGASPCIVDPAKSDFLVDANGNVTTIKFELSTVGADAPFATDDDMANDLAFVEGPDAGTGFPTLATFTLSGLEAGDAYDLYIYAITSLPEYASTFTIGDTSLSTPQNSVFTGILIEGEDYVKFTDIIAAADGTIVCDFTSANPGNYAMFNGLQIVPSATAPKIPGDANNDGKVDGSDVTILAGNWQVLSGANWSMGDFNGDGKVDGSDVTILAGNWQAGVSATAASVPEPSTIVMMLLGMAFSLFFIRRK